MSQTGGRWFDANEIQSEIAARKEDERRIVAAETRAEKAEADCVAMRKALAWLVESREKLEAAVRPGEEGMDTLLHLARHAEAVIIVRGACARAAAALASGAGQALLDRHAEEIKNAVADALYAHDIAERERHKQ